MCVRVGVCCRWLGVLMESVAAIFVLLVALFVVFESGTMSAGVAGLALIYAMQASVNCYHTSYSIT